MSSVEHGELIYPETLSPLRKDLGIPQLNHPSSELSPEDKAEQLRIRETAIIEIPTYSDLLSKIGAFIPDDIRRYFGPGPDLIYLERATNYANTLVIASELAANAYLIANREANYQVNGFSGNDSTFENIRYMDDLLTKIRYRRANLEDAAVFLDAAKRKLSAILNPKNGRTPLEPAGLIGAGLILAQETPWGRELLEELAIPYESITDGTLTQEAEAILLEDPHGSQLEVQGKLPILV